MEKDTDSTRFTLDLNGLLPYQEEVINLYQDSDCLHEEDPDTVAWARLGEESIELLAAVGESSYASPIPGALEYKLADYDENEELDDPLRNIDSPVGSTRFAAALEGLVRLGFILPASWDDEEEAEVVYELDVLETEQIVCKRQGKKWPEHVGRLVRTAVAQGVPEEKVEKVLKDSANKRGILVGLSQEFLDEAGEDSWHKFRKGENNHPSRYAELGKGLKLEYITKIFALDNTSKVILETLKEHAEAYSKERRVKRNLKRDLGVTRAQVDDLGLNL